MRLRITQFIPVIAVLIFGESFGQGQLSRLMVSENQRFLTKEDGSPFVWIGETHWFFAKHPPQTIDSLLDVRSRQGFNVMLVSCREELYDGSGGPGSIGNLNERWWSYLDDYIVRCAERGLYVGITLGWWNRIRRSTEDDLFELGKWVGSRYRHHDNVIWLTMGETGGHARKTGLSYAKVKSLVEGIREGDTGNKLLTVHADFKRGTSIAPEADLCDFNNWQTSQWCCPADLPRKDERSWTVWEAISHDYDLEYEGRAKPTIDLEAWYENNKDFCGATPFTTRRRAYFTILAGAFGHNYGAGGVWDGLNVPEKCSGDGLEATAYSGALAMSHLSGFLHRLGNDFLKLRPNQSLIVEGNSDDYDLHLQSAVAEDKTFGLVYSASDQPYQLDLALLRGKSLRYLWYDPRNHRWSEAMKVQTGDESTPFDPPGALGPGNDWVLVVATTSWMKRYESIR